MAKHVLVVNVMFLCYRPAVIIHSCIVTKMPSCLPDAITTTNLCFLEQVTEVSLPPTLGCYFWKWNKHSS